MDNDRHISSTQNPAIKEIVRLRKRSEREEQAVLVVEGYRECRRALENGWKPSTLYVCPECFLGKNEPEVIALARASGASVISCTREVFEKMAYRDRPEGLLAVGPEIRWSLQDIRLDKPALLVVAEGIEKPGNLGTILRTSDAAGVNGVIVCDPRTDIFNPNVVRASIGTLFTVPVVQTGTEETFAWLRANGIQILAATPHTETLYTEPDLRKPTAIVVGTEQFGLSERWMNEADLKVRIPMLGQADSLNVAAATTILLFEAVRQRA